MTASLARVGAVALFLLQVLGACIPALRRPGLIVRQVYNSGARSLIIIMLCGIVRRYGAGPAGFTTCCRASAANPRWVWLPRLDCSRNSGRW